MAQTLYFYDLETSGVDSRSARIMQFAGIRTNINLDPVGPEDNILIKLTPDILPDPGAVLITGITPQKTLSDGISEAEFLKYFYESIAVPDTVFVGFNSIRFDDEFMRYMNYRNFYDAYEWHWKDGRGRWDILDLARMTRALRPDGINWPFTPDGKPTCKLELLASVNEISHSNAHDALSDVRATLGVAKLLKSAQPKLFDFLFKMKDKREVEKLAMSGLPFVYTSGKYPSEFEKTSIVSTIAQDPNQNGSVFVYDLRRDPSDIIKLTPKEISEHMQVFAKDHAETFPLKRLSFNKCPAIAPTSVLDEKAQERIGLKLEQATANHKVLNSQDDFGDKVQEALVILQKQKQTKMIADVSDVDKQLYDGFFGEKDHTKMRVVRAANAEGLADLHLEFDDSRLEKLLFLYKSRQFPLSLSADEQVEWEKYLKNKLLSGGDQSALAKYFESINQLGSAKNVDDQTKYLLEELRLYGESIMPSDN